jgi:hypothetical protein
MTTADTGFESRLDPLHKQLFFFSSFFYLSSIIVEMGKLSDISIPYTCVVGAGDLGGPLMI